jgi:hypothetical protein
METSNAPAMKATKARAMHSAKTGAVETSTALRESGWCTRKGNRYRRDEENFQPACSRHLTSPSVTR